MVVLQCKNGHFFDVDSFDVCPHCGASVGTDNTSQNNTKSKSKKSLFPWGGKSEIKEKTVSQSNSRIDFTSGSSRSFTNDSIRQNDAQKINNTSSTNSINSANSTTSTVFPPLENGNSNFTDNNGYMGYTPSVSVSTPPNRNAESVFSSMNSGEDKPTVSMFGTISNNENAPSPQQPAAENANPAVSMQNTEANVSPIQADLRNIVNAATGDNQGKTMSYFAAVSSGESSVNKTESANSDKPSSSVYHKSHKADPVVGWLVCVKGGNLGENYYIGAGRNSIGRGADNKIVIDGDATISRNKHAVIVYEPRGRKFYLEPGDASGLVYLNTSNYITASTEIKRGDTIDLGNSTFMFVPLCGEDFSWEEYIK